MSFKKEKLYMKINSYKKKRTRCERTTMENIALNRQYKKKLKISWFYNI